MTNKNASVGMVGDLNNYQHVFMIDGISSGRMQSGEMASDMVGMMMGMNMAKDMMKKWRARLKKEAFRKPHNHTGRNRRQGQVNVQIFVRIAVINLLSFCFFLERPKRTTTDVFI